MNGNNAPFKFDGSNKMHVRILREQRPLMVEFTAPTPEEKDVYDWETKILREYQRKRLETKSQEESVNRKGGEGENRILQGRRRSVRRYPGIPGGTRKYSGRRRSRRYIDRVEAA